MMVEKSAKVFPRGLLDVPQAAFTTAAFGTCLLSAESVIVDANDEFCRLLGYDRGEVVDRNLLEVVHPDDYRLIARIHGAMRRGEIDTDQTRRLYVRKDGEVLYAMAGVTAIRGEDGELLGILKQIQDVTRRVRAERQLQESLARQRVIFDSLVDGVLVLDEDGRVRLSNPAAREILGVAEEDLVGTEYPLVELTDEEGGVVSRAETAFERALASGEAQKGVILCAHRPDGEKRWIQANAQPLVAPGGERRMVVLSFADVTVAKRRPVEDGDPC